MKKRFTTKPMEEYKVKQFSTAVCKETNRKRTEEKKKKKNDQSIQVFKNVVKAGGSK
jgi:hypothetical protein